MNFLKNLFSNSAKGIVKDASDLIDTISTSDEEKQHLKSQLSNLIIKGATDMYSLQASVIQTEAGGNFLQRSWRPITMLAFAAVVVLGAFIEIPYAQADHDFWNLLQLGIGGYIIGRSGEKITDTISKNMDLTLLKKKDRKDKYQI